MSRLLVVVALAGLCFAGIAPAESTLPSAPPPADARPVSDPIPVPDGPVVQREEREGGLLVEDMVIGTGHEVKPGMAVVAHYHGTLKSTGAEFDSSFTRGEPASFHLDGVIAGWTKGLPGMKVGGVRRLTIPSALAYGERSPSDKIPANADLVFVVRLEDALFYEDVTDGTGDEASGMCVAVTTHSVTDGDGHEVEKADMSDPYVWLPGEMNAMGTQFDTMQLVFNGMKVGGVRRVFIPAPMNGAPPQLEVKRPTNVPLVIEFKLIAVRNLPQQQQPGRRR